MTHLVGSPSLRWVVARAESAVTCCPSSAQVKREEKDKTSGPTRWPKETPASLWLRGAPANVLTGAPPPRHLEPTHATGSPEVEAARASSCAGVPESDNLPHGSVTQPPRHSRSPAGTAKSKAWEGNRPPVAIHTGVDRSRLEGRQAKGWAGPPHPHTHRSRKLVLGDRTG